MTDPRLEKLRSIDEQLALQGWPKISDWWWRVITDFYESGVLGCVITGGRRGGKSSTLMGKVACAELLTMVDGKYLHDVPPGDIGYFAMVSAEKNQAKARVATCRKALIALGVQLGVDNKEEITIKGSDRGVLAVTATKTGAVSFTCIGALLDEMALWRDDTDDNPAREVVESLKPTMATMPNARAWYVSAPWAKLGMHYELSQEGDNESQRVFHGATWEMNPTITEAQTHLLERDYASWQRQYAAVPMDADEHKFFNAQFVDAARQRIFEWTPGRTASGGDFAFRRDSSALVVLSQQLKEFRVDLDEERIPNGKALVPSLTIQDLVGIAVQNDADSIASDLHYIETVRETTDALALNLLEYPSHENDTWYVRLRVLLSEGLIDLSKASERLINQMKAATANPLDGGRLKIEVKRTDNVAHGDILSALVCAVWAMDQPVEIADNAITGNRRFGRGGDGKANDWPGWP